MKGLLIKDLKYLKGQKTFFGSFLMIMAVFMAFYTNFSFVISYGAVMMGILALTTISYDEYENGMGFLFTLPVSRKLYVMEKYLFIIVTTILGLGVVSVLVFIVSRLRHISWPAEEWLLSVPVSFMVITVLMSFLVPIQLKFGAEKSRAAFLIAYGGVFLTGYLGIKVCDALGIDWREGLDRIASFEPAIVLSVVVIICGIILLVSYLFSLRFMGKREF